MAARALTTSTARIILSLSQHLNSLSSSSTKISYINTCMFTNQIVNVYICNLFCIFILRNLYIYTHLNFASLGDQSVSWGSECVVLVLFLYTTCKHFCFGIGPIVFVLRYKHCFQNHFRKISCLTKGHK